MFFFWPESDEKYLKKSTLKMIDLLVSPLDSSDMSSLVGRVRKVVEPLHFSVQFEVSQNGRVLFKRESAADLRSLTGMYFKSEGRLALKNVKEENLTVQLSEENGKSAQVNFSITGQSQSRPLSCRVRIDWKYEKDWRIYHIRAFDCQGIQALDGGTI